MNPGISKQAASAKNPILRGFNPDPSIVRVEGDYFLATSTFEWFPGIPIYHSRDLANWRMIGHALTRADLADLQGVPDSGGIWAPALSFADGVFYILYTIVHNRTGPFRDVNNYLITAPSITGPWSPPVYLNSSGFDPSLFHDADGRKWVTNMQWDHRPDHFRFAGIILQEYDPSAGQLTGPIFDLCRKDAIIEGPNLYKHADYYYLMLAEGGTDWNHSISMLRSKVLMGPYESDPQPFVLTSRTHPALPLQKAGHGELVQTPDGGWYLAHLCSRPLYPPRRCPLGRETAIQEVHWTNDGWLRLSGGDDAPKTTFALPDPTSPPSVRPTLVRDDFDEPELSADWQALRIPVESSWANTTERPGFLRLRGRQSLQSLHHQSLIARRITEFQADVETAVDFNPDTYLQSAGLVLYHDTRHHYYLRVTHDEDKGRTLGLATTIGGAITEYPNDELVINDWKRIYLRADIDGIDVTFAASADGQIWQQFPGKHDFSLLSSDFAGGFTGAMAGVCVQDLRGSQAIADFDYFQIRTVIPVDG